MSGATYREVQVKGALNAVKGMPFEWSLNPFLGCVHACSYCFARAYHARYRERNVGTDFDRDIEVRVNIADVLRHELRQPREGSLAIGTATDPYQPIEGKYRLTRRCLEALVERPLSTSIITKGPLIVRDIDVLSELDRKADLTIYFSVPCVDEDVVRRTDPGTAPARQRLRALARLREAGLDAAVLCMPVLPGISDSEESLDRAARAASSEMSSSSTRRTPPAVAAMARSETHHGTRIPRSRSRDSAPGPARSRAQATAMFVAGSSAPPWLTQMGLSPWPFRHATIIGAVATIGPSGKRSPSAVSAPPVISPAPATSAHLSTGRMPRPS